MDRAAQEEIKDMASALEAAAKLGTEKHVAELRSLIEQHKAKSSLPWQPFAYIYLVGLKER